MYKDFGLSGIVLYVVVWWSSTNVSKEPAAPIFRAEEGESCFLWNAGRPNYLPNYIVAHPTRPILITVCSDETISETVLDEGPETVRDGPLGCPGRHPTDVPAMDSFRRDLSTLPVSHAHSHVTTCVSSAGNGFHLNSPRETNEGTFSRIYELVVSRINSSCSVQGWKGPLVIAAWLYWQHTSLLYMRRRGNRVETRGCDLTADYNIEPCFDLYDVDIWNFFPPVVTICVLTFIWRYILMRVMRWQHWSGAVYLCLLAHKFIFRNYL